MEYYKELTESIKSIFELTTRIDERMQLMTKKQEAIDAALKSQGELISNLSSRIIILENSINSKDIEQDVDKNRDKIHALEVKVNSLQISNEGTEGRWKTIVNFSLQIIWVLLAAYLLYKLGLQAPAVP